MARLFEKYIVCPDCQIGGYDFCEKCLGAGGYTIKVSTDPNLENPTFKSTKLTSINKQLDLIVQRGIWNSKIDEKLSEYFSLLAESVYTPEVIGTLKRIIKIKKANSGKKLLYLYREKIKLIDSLKFTFLESKVLLNCNTKYFELTKHGEIVYKLKPSQLISFSPYLLKEFLDYLENNSILKLKKPDEFKNYRIRYYKHKWFLILNMGEVSDASIYSPHRQKSTFLYFVY